MTDDENNKLEMVIQGCKENWDRLSEWEQDFITSIEERHQQYGERIWISLKQWGVIDRLYDKVVG